MGWMLPSMCLLLPLKMPPITSSCCKEFPVGCPTHLRNYQTASWKVLETPWSSRTKLWIFFVDKLFVYNTCVHSLRRAFICGIHVTYRYIICIGVWKQLIQIMYALCTAKSMRPACQAHTTTWSALAAAQFLAPAVLHWDKVEGFAFAHIMCSRNWVLLARFVAPCQHILLQTTWPQYASNMLHD